MHAYAIAIVRNAQFGVERNIIRTKQVIIASQQYEMHIKKEKLERTQ